MNTNPRSRKSMTWGLVTMFLIAPLFSWILGVLGGSMAPSEYAAEGLMMLLFPIIFIIGSVIFMKGFNEPKQM
ncbi:hypothetical protein SAMN05421743_101323 [Thalassobacillus cyri]|uniref:Uncharacterized protein n=1 Tax=Thalassobacillus cyri TaxID=571932 RepID=A0A1H3W7E3_9BACI|nr:hypothetical protein [Thalassobacillus cyri]SDZ82262.1 hypothetical protein SAMN05421743_101323 [Thalassobacillus cyri]